MAALNDLTRTLYRRDPDLSDIVAKASHEHLEQRRHQTAGPSAHDIVQKRTKTSLFSPDTVVRGAAFVQAQGSRPVEQHRMAALVQIPEHRQEKA
jgi:hypothetical protein